MGTSKPGYGYRSLTFQQCNLAHSIGIFYFSRDNTERKFQVMWFLEDFETVEARRAIDNKNNFDLGESGSREGIHSKEKPWLFEVM